VAESRDQSKRRLVISTVASDRLRLTVRWITGRVVARSGSEGSRSSLTCGPTPAGPGRVSRGGQRGGVVEVMSGGKPRRSGLA